MNGWMNGCMNECMHGWMDEWIDRHPSEKQSGLQGEVRRKSQLGFQDLMDRWIVDGWMNGRCMDEW